MKIKILKIYEKEEILRVETECEYGKDNLGLSIDAKYKDIDGEYKWLKEVKTLLKNKYQPLKKEIFKQFKNKSLTI